MACKCNPPPLFSYKGKQMPPTFDLTLKPITVNESETFSLICHVCGSYPLSIQWMKDRRELIPSANCKITFVDGTATLIVAKASKQDSGDYLCKATNNAGTDFSKAKVTIKGKIWKKNLHCPHILDLNFFLFFFIEE